MDQSLPESQSEERKRKFTQQESDHFMEFFLTLKEIEVRLISEGYTIKDGVVTPPPHKLAELEAKELGQKRGRRPKGWPNIF